MPDCDKEGCNFTAETYNELQTHNLLKHPDQMDDTENFESEVSDGHLNTETRAEKGEEFGY
jgi:hypothetical protein